MLNKKLKNMGTLKTVETLEATEKLKKMKIKKKKISINPKGLLKSVKARNKKFRELMKALDDK